jgi:hypothetical protein
MWIPSFVQPTERIRRRRTEFRQLGLKKYHELEINTWASTGRRPSVLWASEHQQVGRWLWKCATFQGGWWRQQDYESAGGAENHGEMFLDLTTDFPMFAWLLTTVALLRSSHILLCVSRASHLFVPPLLGVGDTQTAWLFSCECLKVKGTPLRSQGLYPKNILIETQTKADRGWWGNMGEACVYYH